MSNSAEAWMADQHPDEEPLPSPESGRNHRQEQLSEQDSYFEAGADRPGVHRPPAVHRAEALASQPASQPLDPCSHCGTEEVAHGRVYYHGKIYHDLGNRCYRRLRKKGRLPDLG